MVSLIVEKAVGAVHSIGYIGLAAIAIISYNILLAVYNIYFHPLRHYPGPLLARANPLYRFLYLASGHETTWLTSLHLKYGHAVRICPNEISYTSAEAWKDIYGVGSKTAGRKWAGVYNHANPQLQTLQGANDEDHPVLRRIFSPAFSEKALREQQGLLKGYADAVVKRLVRFVEEKSDIGKDGKKGREVDLVQVFGFVTFDIMGDLAFGQSMKMIENMETVVWIRKHFETIRLGTVFRLGGYFPIVQPLLDLFIWFSRDALWYTYDNIKGFVDQRLEKKDVEHPDIWKFVLRDQDSEDARKLSPHEMRTHGLLFMFAGTETTATLLSGLSYLLLTHPEKMEKLKDEIRGTFKSTDEMTMFSLAQSRYLNDCLEEGLRVFPPVPSGMPRETPPEGAMINGEHVAGNTVVYVSQAPAYHLPTNFRNPDEFIPERWSSPEYSSDQKAVLQPFLFGARNCIGKSLAYHEMRLVLAYMIYHFDMELAPSTRKEWMKQRSFMLWEKTPLMVKLIPVRAVE